MKIAMISVIIVLLCLLLVSSPTSQTQLPEQSTLLTACNYATALGASEGIKVSNCRRLSEEVYGNVALEKVRVKVEGQGWFTVNLWMFRSEWSVHSVSIDVG